MDNRSKQKPQPPRKIPMFPNPDDQPMTLKEKVLLIGARAKTLTLAHQACVENDLHEKDKDACWAMWQETEQIMFLLALLAEEIND